jgi:hypothetical protein
MRRLAPVVLLVLSLSVAVPAVSDAKVKKQPNHRRGGSVQQAWPRDKDGRPPATALARWLASQVGPVPVKAVRHPRVPSRTTGSLAQAASAAPAGSTPMALAAVTANAAATESTSLLLVRSFDIPKTDADYDRLANLSWTYDNALAALAFTDQNAKSQAVQILDQLKALQRTDGALGFAYDVRTGAASGQVRTNALAWVGIAAVAYREKYNDSRYDQMIGGVAKYLLTLRRSDGLLVGGPDVAWVSTQHNILGAEFFRSAGEEFGGKSINGTSITGTQLTAQYNTTAGAILSNKLLVQSGGQAYFVQGLNDARIPLDVQTLGSVFLRERGDSRAAQVASWMTTNLYQPPRVVDKRTWSGYMPFAGTTAPNVIWSEGTIQADWALKRLKISSLATDLAVLGIYGTTDDGSSGPLGADRAVSDQAWGEFPSWPTSAAGSWLLIVAGGGDVLFN